MFIDWEGIASYGHVRFGQLPNCQLQVTCHLVFRVLDNILQIRSKPTMVGHIVSSHRRVILCCIHRIVGFPIPGPMHDIIAQRMILVVFTRRVKYSIRACAILIESPHKGPG
jgi:hypothetical protein